MSAFKQAIQTEAELRDTLGYAGKAARDQVIPEVDDICRVCEPVQVITGETA